MEGQMRRIAQQTPIGTGAGISTVLLTTAFGNPTSVPSGFCAFWTDSVTSLLHFVWSDGTSWHSVPVPPTLGQVYTQRIITATALDASASGGTNRVWGAGAGATIGIVFGKNVTVTKVQDTCYNAAGDLANLPVAVYKNNASAANYTQATASAAWSAGSGVVSVAYNPTDLFGILLTNASTGALTWGSLAVTYTELD